MTAENLRSNLAWLLVLAVGLLGLIHEHLRVLFGLLLWVWVVARFYQGVRQTPPMPMADLHMLVRELSRAVYLLLYVLMFFRIASGMVRAAPHWPLFAPVEDFQGFLACGLIALGTIHALAALFRHGAFRGAKEPLRPLSAKRPADVA